MNYEKVIMSIAIMTVMFSTGIPRVDASDIDDFDNFGNKGVKTERIIESIESSDYETWKRLVNPNSKIAKTVSEENFNQFVRARNLARQGAYQESLAVYSNLKIKLSLKEKDIKKIVNYLRKQNKETIFYQYE